nr:circumsporozoite protein-like [Halyomorpha halys]
MLSFFFLVVGTFGEEHGKRVETWLSSAAAGAGPLGAAASGGRTGGKGAFASAAAAPPAYAATAIGSRLRRRVSVSGGQLSSGITSGSVSVGLAMGGGAASGGSAPLALGSTSASAPGVATAVSLGQRDPGAAAAAASRAGPVIATVSRCWKDRKGKVCNS